MSQRTEAALLAALVAALFALSILTYFHLGEDAFISFRYARNLAHGRDLVFNPGERVEGYSNLLWVLLMAPCEWLGLRMHVVARLLSTASFAALAVAGWWAARRLTAEDAPTLLRWGLPLAIALDPLLHFHDDQGLETVPYAALLGGALLALAASDKLLPAALLAGAATLTRPEGIGFAVALVPLVAMGGGKDRKDFKDLKDGGRGVRVLKFLALPVGLFLLQLIFRRMTYGEWVPNTVIAKRSGGAGGFDQVLAFTASRAFVPLVAAGGVLWALRSERYRRLALGALCLGGAAILFQIRAGGLLNTGFRYLAPAFVPVAVGVWLAMAMVREALDDAFPRGLGNRLAAGAVVALLLPVPVLLVGEGRYLRGNTDAYLSRFHKRLFQKQTWNVPERLRVFFADPIFLNADVGHWAAKNLPADTLLASDQMGQLGFYAPQPIVDLLGLMDSHVARHGLTMEYLAQRRPKYLLVESCRDSTFWPRAMRRQPHVDSLRQLFATPEFKALYRPRWFLQPRFGEGVGFMVYAEKGVDDRKPLEDVAVGATAQEFETAWRVGIVP